MAKINTNKAISANSNGIVVSFRDANKNRFIPYENTLVKDIQVSGTVKYQTVEKTTHFTELQKNLYQRVVFGFKAYSPEEIKAMNEHTKTNITIRYTKVQRLLKRWKQDLLFKAVDDFLGCLFPHSELVKQMKSVTGYTNDDHEDNISLNEVGITKVQIADKLIELGLLPKNFYQLQ